MRNRAKNPPPEQKPRETIRQAKPTSVAPPPRYRAPSAAPSVPTSRISEAVRRVTQAYKPARSIRQTRKESPTATRTEVRSPVKTKRSVIKPSEDASDDSSGEELLKYTGMILKRRKEMMRLTKGVESSSSDDGLVKKDVLRKIVQEKEGEKKASMRTKPFSKMTIEEPSESDEVDVENPFPVAKQETVLGTSGFVGFEVPPKEGTKKGMFDVSDSDDLEVDKKKDVVSDMGIKKKPVGKIAVDISDSDDSIFDLKPKKKDGKPVESAMKKKSWLDISSSGDMSVPDVKAPKKKSVLDLSDSDLDIPVPSGKAGAKSPVKKNGSVNLYGISSSSDSDIDFQVPTSTKQASPKGKQVDVSDSSDDFDFDLNIGSKKEGKKSPGLKDATKKSWLDVSSDDASVPAKAVSHSSPKKVVVDSSDSDLDFDIPTTIGSKAVGSTKASAPQEKQQSPAKKAPHGDSDIQAPPKKQSAIDLSLSDSDDIDIPLAAPKKQATPIAKTSSSPKPSEEKQLKQDRFRELNLSDSDEQLSPKNASTRAAPNFNLSQGSSAKGRPPSTDLGVDISDSSDLDIEIPKRPSKAAIHTGLSDSSSSDISLPAKKLPTPKTQKQTLSGSNSKVQTGTQQAKKVTLEEKQKNWLDISSSEDGAMPDLSASPKAGILKKPLATKREQNSDLLKQSSKQNETAKQKAGLDIDGISSSTDSDGMPPPPKRPVAKAPAAGLSSDSDSFTLKTQQSQKRATPISKLPELPSSDSDLDIKVPEPKKRVTPSAKHTGLSSDSDEIQLKTPEPRKSPVPAPTTGLSSSSSDGLDIKLGSQKKATAPSPATKNSKLSSLDAENTKAQQSKKPSQKVKIPGFSSSDSLELDTKVPEQKKKQTGSKLPDLSSSDSELDIKVPEPKKQPTPTPKLPDLSSSDSGLDIKVPEPRKQPTPTSKLPDLSSSDSDLDIKVHVTPAASTGASENIHGSSSDSGNIGIRVPERTKQPKMSDLSSSDADDHGGIMSNSKNETAPKVKIPGFSSSDSDDLVANVDEPKKQAPTNPKTPSIDMQLSDSDDLDIRTSEPKVSVTPTTGGKIPNLSSSGSDDLGVQVQKTVVPTQAAKISTLSSSDSEGLDIAIQQPKKDLGPTPIGQNPGLSSDSEDSDVPGISGGESGRDLSHVQTAATKQSNPRVDISSDSAGQSPSQQSTGGSPDKKSSVRTAPNSATKTEVMVQNSDTEGDSEGIGGRMKPQNRFMELSLSDDLSDDDTGKPEPSKQVNVQEMARSFLDSDDDDIDVPKEQKKSVASDSSDDFDFETHTMKKETTGQTSSQLTNQELESKGARIRAEEGTDPERKKTSPLGTRKNIDLQLEIPDRGQSVRVQQKKDEEEDLEVKMDIDFDQFDGNPAPHNISTPIPDHTGDFDGPYEEEDISSSDVRMNIKSVDKERQIHRRDQIEVEEEDIHLEEEAIQEEEEELEVKMDIDFDQFDGEKAPHNISTPIPGTHSSFGDDEPSSPTVTMDIDFAKFDNTKPLHLMSTPRPGQLQFGEDLLEEEEDLQILDDAEEHLDEEEQVLERPKKMSVQDLPADSMNRQKRDENDSTFERDLDDIGRKFNLNLSDDSDGAEGGDDEQPSEIIAKMKQMFPDLNLDSSSEEDDT